MQKVTSIRCIVNHFARFRRLEYNLKIVKRGNLKHVELGKTHDIYHLPSKWQVNVEEIFTRRVVL